MSFHRRYTQTVTLLSAVALLLLLAACESDDTSVAPYYHQVIAQPLDEQPDYRIERFFVGQVEARQRAELGFELPGTIAEVLVDEGDLVAAGQLLGRLDDALLRAEIDEINAQSDDLGAQLVLARLNLKRQQELIRQGFAAEQRIDELHAEISSISARLKRQQALLQSANTRLAKHNLVAPYAGEIAIRYADAGGIAVAGQAVVQLLEQGIAEARIGVPARLAASLRPGDHVQVLAASRLLSASVLAVASNIDAITRTSSVRLAMPPDEGIVDGEMVYLRLYEKVDQAGYWVPDTALSAGVRGLWNLFVLVPTEQSDIYLIERRSIELQHMAEGKAFVSGSVRSGELALAVGLHRVSPGLSVQLQSVNESSLKIDNALSVSDG